MTVHAVTEVCARGQEVLKELQPQGVPHAEFFEMDNLWRIEIWGTCQPLIECYQSILLLTDQRFLRPAAALSRSVHEAHIRFEYLADNEHELRSCIEWQMSRAYHRNLDYLRYDAGLHPQSDREARALKRDFEALLGRRPKKPPYPWRGNAMMLENIAGHFPSGFHKMLLRRLIEYPSEYVHIGVSSEPAADSVIGTTELCVLLTIQRAMKLCRDKQLTSSRARETANEIVMLCDEWIESEAKQQ